MGKGRGSFRRRWSREKNPGHRPDGTGGESPGSPAKPSQGAPPRPEHANDFQEESLVLASLQRDIQQADKRLRELEKVKGLPSRASREQSAGGSSGGRCAPKVALDRRFTLDNSHIRKSGRSAHVSSLGVIPAGRSYGSSLQEQAPCVDDAEVACGGDLEADVARQRGVEPLGGPRDNGAHAASAEQTGLECSTPAEVIEALGIGHLRKVEATLAAWSKDKSRQRDIDRVVDDPFFPSASAEQFLETAGRLRGLMHEIEDHTGWKLAANGEMKLWHRHVKGTTEQHFKAEMTLSAETRHIISLGREFDLLKTWNKYCIQSDILKTLSLSMIWAYSCVWMPWPFKCRQAFVEAGGWTMLDDPLECVAIGMRSPVDDPREFPADVAVPAEAAKRSTVRVCPTSCAKMRPLPPAADGTPRTRCIAQICVDGGVNFPDILVTFVLKVFAPFMFYVVKRVLRTQFLDASTPLMKRMAGDRKPLYDAIRALTDDYLLGKARRQSAANRARIR